MRKWSYVNWRGISLLSLFLTIAIVALMRVLNLDEWVFKAVAHTTESPLLRQAITLGLEAVTLFLTMYWLVGFPRRLREQKEAPHVSLAPNKTTQFPVDTILSDDKAVPAKENAQLDIAEALAADRIVLNFEGQHVTGLTFDSAWKLKVIRHAKTKRIVILRHKTDETIAVIEDTSLILNIPK